ncbi:MAG: hypothetical protein ACXWC4_01560 [Telluria sp.]
MKTFLRILIVWLALLAVPFQGFAAAAALGCAHGTQHAPVAAMQHDHACHHHKSATARHHDGKCSNCAACCIGAAIAPPTVSLAGPAAVTGHPVASDAGPVPDADPDHPERPPRFTRA